MGSRGSGSSKSGGSAGRSKAVGSENNPISLEEYKKLSDNKDMTPQEKSNAIKQKTEVLQNMPEGAQIKFSRYSYRSDITDTYTYEKQKGEWNTVKVSKFATMFRGVTNSELADLTMRYDDGQRITIKEIKYPAK